eukprot:gnl/MRDRNA2_/MRDRNA2_158009_c0_seq1.p1 gnl/MRDRNA2_/MRDRNA2_158009_c0~~gnl/MRDRNA2_/MRDRNA2_158009_c0_seq1.p1  ORF type:complete len:267 (-),score=35.86 gnl/MRDRNA2_/MRDRNA2_158009_c0_seq1:103-864(-)
MAGRLVANCRVVKCQPNEFQTGWVHGQGFANCQKARIGIEEFKQRKAFYNKVLGQDLALTHPKFRKLTASNISLPAHKMWELALRINFSSIFQMPESFSEEEMSDEYVRILSWKYLAQNPAGQLVGGLIKLAFNLLEHAMDLVGSVAVDVKDTLTAPFTKNSKKVTQQIVHNFYWDNCMAIKCLRQMHPNFKSERDFNKMKELCSAAGDALYREDDYDNQDFQDAQVDYLLKQFAGNNMDIQQTSVLQPFDDV